MARGGKPAISASFWLHYTAPLNSLQEFCVFLVLTQWIIQWGYRRKLSFIVLHSVVHTKLHYCYSSSCVRNGKKEDCSNPAHIHTLLHQANHCIKWGCWFRKNIVRHTNPTANKSNIIAVFPFSCGITTSPALQSSLVLEMVNQHVLPPVQNESPSASFHLPVRSIKEGIMYVQRCLTNEQESLKKWQEHHPCWLPL